MVQFAKAFSDRQIVATLWRHLELDAAGIHIAAYLTEPPPRDLLHRRLQAAFEAAQVRLKPESKET